MYIRQYLLTDIWTPFYVYFELICIMLNFFQMVCLQTCLSQLGRRACNSSSASHVLVPSRSFNFGAECCNQSVPDIAKGIDKAENILVMAGAGMSTPSGIPDFRSPGKNR
jgi:hypothetical protein